MRRLYCLLIIAGMTLCACANPAMTRDIPPEPELTATAEKPMETVMPAETDLPEDSPAPATAEGFCFYTLGKAVPLGIGEEEVLAILGVAQQVFEIPSCAFEGIDRILYYSGFNINCSPLETGYFVWSIALTDDSAETEEGAYVGMSRAEILAIYGRPAEEGELLLSYKRSGTRLVFVFEADKVVEITYYYDKVLGRI